MYVVVTGAACIVEKRHAALLSRPARGTACKGLFNQAVRDWAGFLYTAARAGRDRFDPRDAQPAAGRDGTGRDDLFDIPILSTRKSSRKIIFFYL